MGTGRNWAVVGYKEKTMSKDTIYREDAIGACAYETIECYEARKAIRALPSADRPQGEWKRRLVDSGFNADWVCSECGYRVKTDFVSFNYCPNCGADMRKGADDETRNETV